MFAMEEKTKVRALGLETAPGHSQCSGMAENHSSPTRDFSHTALRKEEAIPAAAKSSNPSQPAPGDEVQTVILPRFRKNSTDSGVQDPSEVYYPPSPRDSVYQGPENVRNGLEVSFRVTFPIGDVNGETKGLPHSHEVKGILFSIEV